MPPSTVLDVLQMDPGAIVPAVTGTITKLYPRTQKQGARGPYSYQGGELSDGEQTIKFTIWDKPDMSKLKMKEVLLESVPSQKGNDLIGLEFGADNQNTPQLHIRKQAKIGLAGATGGGADPHSQDPDMQNSDLDEGSPPPAKTPPAKTPPAKSAGVAADKLEKPTRRDLDTETRKDALRMANLRIIAAHTTDLFYAKYRETGGKREYSAADLKDVETGFFITLDRLGHLSAMPAKPIYADAPPAPAPEKKPEEPPAV